ncbi:MAG: sodium/proton-translocating pyrophosphatase, partial [Thermoguttaceae bacterium]|nr:sodium/proton-translocating pyrophosphatase [Thermoguttaceae bacterium]
MKINKSWAKGLTCAFLASLVFGAVAPSFAQEATQVAANAAASAEAVETVVGAERVGFFSLFGFLWVLSLAGAVAALVFAVKFFKTMMKADEGNEEMIKIAAAVRKGANAYLKQQYKVVAIFFVVIWAFLMYLAWGPGVQNKIVPWAFLTGGFFSGLAGWFGMKTATW